MYEKVNIAARKMKKAKKIKPQTNTSTGSKPYVENLLTGKYTHGSNKTGLEPDILFYKLYDKYEIEQE